MYAYKELKKQLDNIDELRFIFTSPTFVKESAKKEKREFFIPRLDRESGLYGTEFEIKLRNEMTQKAIAKECADWIKAKVKFRSNVSGDSMGGFITVESPADTTAYMPIMGFTTTDIGCDRGNNAYNMVNSLDAPFAQQYISVFNELWNDKSKLEDVTETVIESISTAYNENAPEFIYFMTLYHVFSEFLEDISEDELPNEATGFKQSKIWDMLYDFQRDAVLAIINKLEKYNGCILADSVGLGKTFTALAVIKYYENRNKTVLVLCPKKLAENWNTYKDNYVNNPIASDRLNYDVLFHTDLSRDGGYSNGLDLDRLNWGNYDLIVIDESHNFRNGIDIIAKTNPVLVIDEPQSVEGKQTKERLKEFKPILTLRYSATHKSDSIYNMIYRLDALEAYNKKLVKKIAVKGISASGTTGTEGFVFLESINVSGANPTATIRFDVKGKTGVRQVSRTVNEGFNLYDQSGQLEEYKNGYTVSCIDARDDHIEFINGKKLFLGDIMGSIDEEQIRRIQIHETIVSHIERERQLFHKGIKVLSLFFIDEVAKYKQYDESGQPVNGIYADMFEEEYKAVIENYQREFGDDDYIRYLDAITAESTHAGYFSVDKKGKLTDGKIDKKEQTSDDVSAYDLIMKNKELLLDRDPKRSPVRFIFSHSALREGWDNPNVFQICTLKQSTSEVRKRQEVGRGLRLCVNEDGDRMDTGVLGNEVHNINVLTVIASESYDSFAKGLQSEIAEAVAYRPKTVTADLFKGREISDDKGNTQVIDDDTAQAIYEDSNEIAILSPSTGSGTPCRQLR